MIDDDAINGFGVGVAPPPASALAPAPWRDTTFPAPVVNWSRTLVGEKLCVGATSRTMSAGGAPVGMRATARRTC